MPLEAAAPPADDAGKLARERKRKMILHMLIYVGAGSILGFAYYKLVGCSSGGCPITSNPYVATLYGAMIGLIAGSGLGR